jgi:hypothetical protein
MLKKTKVINTTFDDYVEKHGWLCYAHMQEQHMPLELWGLNLNWDKSPCCVEGCDKRGQWSKIILPPIKIKENNNA